MVDTLIREGQSFQSTPLVPVPQYWNGSGYTKVQGTAGAMYVAILGTVSLTGSSAVAIADGADAALGAKADAAVSTAGTGSVIALLKGMQTILGSVTASPTTNTVGDRLKTIALNTGTSSTAATSILASVGAVSDAAATGNGSLIAVAKQLRTILNDVWDDPNNRLNIGGAVSISAGSTIAVSSGTVGIATGSVIGISAGSTVGIATVPVVGSHGNAWTTSSVGAGGTSSSVDCQYQRTVSAFGNVSAATTISVYVSQDNTNYYDTGEAKVLNGSGNFHLSITTAARYVRLMSSSAATITATIAGK